MCMVPIQLNLSIHLYLDWQWQQQQQRQPPPQESSYILSFFVATYTCIYIRNTTPTNAPRR